MYIQNVGMGVYDSHSVRYCSQLHPLQNIMLETFCEEVIIGSGKHIKARENILD